MSEVSKAQAKALRLQIARKQAVCLALKLEEVFRADQRACKKSDCGYILEGLLKIVNLLSCSIDKE